MPNLHEVSESESQVLQFQDLEPRQALRAEEADRWTRRTFCLPLVVDRTTSIRPEPIEEFLSFSSSLWVSGKADLDNGVVEAKASPRVVVYTEFPEGGDGVYCIGYFCHEYETGHGCDVES